MLTKAENIPEELKRLSQWVCVSKTDKIPKNPFNGKNAQANNPKTWGTFEQAVKACESFGFDYIGLQLIMLVAGLVIFLVMTGLSYKAACRNFELIDL